MGYLNVKGREIPLAIMIFSGLAVILEYFFVPVKSINAGAIVSRWSLILFAYAGVLAMFRSLLIHVGHIQTKTKDQWPYSILFLVILGVHILTGLVFGVTANETDWLYYNIAGAVGAAMSSTIGLFVVLAAYRAFRLASVDTSLLIITGILTVLGNISVAEILWPGFPYLRAWIMDVIVKPGSRIIAVLMALGLIAMAIRTFLGIEVSLKSFQR